MVAEVVVGKRLEGVLLSSGTKTFVLGERKRGEEAVVCFLLARLVPASVDVRPIVLVFVLVLVVAMFVQMEHMHSAQRVLRERQVRHRKHLAAPLCG